MKPGLGTREGRGASLSMWVRFSRALIQATGLLLVGIALGVLSKEIQGLEIPWSGGWSEKEAVARHLEGLEEISLDDAWKAYQSGQALFLDARDHGSFSREHLPGALNVPPSEVERFSGEIRVLVQAGMIPIAYCDGVDCPLSSELARGLREVGIEGVKVLVNGLSRWRDTGYPVESAN